MAKRFFALLVLLLLPFPAQAQTWPQQPIKIVVPYAPGGATDILARQLADRLTEELGQAVVVENRGGAGGMVGANTVAKAAPDGYTLLVCSTAEIAINQSVYKKMNYDPVKDFAPITLMAWTPLVIVANPSLNVTTPADLIALLKSKPGAYNFSSPGVGSAQHLSGEYLKKLAGVDMQHITYRGAGPAVQDAVSGQVPITIAGVPPVIELIRSGHLKAIAATSAKRSPQLGDVPALADLGPAYADFDIVNWFGLLAPAGVSEAIRTRLHQASVKALSLPAVQARIAQQGANVVGSSPAEFAAFIAAEIEKYKRIVAATGVRIE